MPDHGAGQTELVVVARPDASLRAHGARVTSVVDADTSSLNSLLEAHGARLQPLFGLSEERLRDRAPVSAGPSTASTGQAEAPIEDLTLFYRAIAHEDRLDELAQELLANELVEAAYVKPAAAPPCAAVAPTPGINDMQPDAGDAPPATPDFVQRQGYLAVTPGGVDAAFARTTPGGAGKGVRIIDCEWAWRFTHEDLLDNQGGVVAGTSMGNADHGTTSQD